MGSKSEIIDIAKKLSARGWCPATGGNFSKRISDQSFLVTISGVDKGELTDSDFVECGVESGDSLDSEKQPSAESLLHAMLYRLDKDIGAVLHTHSVPVTTASLKESKHEFSFSGYEMQKAISGIRSHEEELLLPIFPNSQDIRSLVNTVQERIATISPCYGFVLRGHGLYAWGKDTKEALRHLEGYEFLVECLHSK